MSQAEPSGKSTKTEAHGSGTSPKAGEIEASQDRSRRTRDKLVKGFGKLLREKDFDAITMAELAGESGVAVGTVYRRFANKEALIPVIFEVYMDAIRAQSAKPGHQFSLADTDTLWTAVWSLCDVAWRTLKSEPQLIRTAHLYARLRPDLVGEDWDEIIDASVGQFRQVIGHFSHEVQRPDIDAAARMVFYLVNTVMVEQVLYGDAGPGAALKVDDEAFVEDCATTIYGYLTVGEA
jgi:AcrR family transcriptional regulator